MAHVVSLHRYPVKGFEGETLDSVSLVCGAGVPGDRVVGITRGGIAKGSAPFHQLTTNPSLVHYRPGRQLTALTLHERTADARPDLFSDPARLRELFGEQKTWGL